MRSARPTFTSGKKCLTVKPEAMETNLKGFWNEKKDRLKKNYPMLTEKDLSFREGKEKEMIELLGYKLGKTQQELLKIIVTI